MKTSGRGLFSKQKKPFFSSGKARFCSRREMLSIAQKYLPNPTASCLPLSEELSSGFQSSTPLSSAYIYNVRARGRRAGGKPATAVPTRFVLEKKSACPAPEYVFGKAQRAFTSTSEMFCERQKNCFWHSKQTKEERGKTSCRGFYFPFSRICSNPCAASKNVWRVARANCRWKWRFTGTLR